MLKLKEGCISCGICAKVCPTQIIRLSEGKPAILSDNCIRCGHCIAACPKGVLENESVPAGNLLPINQYPVLTGDEAELFLRSRRSIRCFKPDEVTPEETRRLVDIGRYAQTGSNSQGVSYMVLGKEMTKELRRLTMEFFGSQEDEFVKKMYQAFAESERDLLFRGAPMCILALTGKDKPYTFANARYALTYIELLAPSLGLGTCWAGYLEHYTAADSREVRDLLKLPEEYVIAGALLYGYPQYRYYRTTARDEAAIFWR